MRKRKLKPRPPSQPMTSHQYRDALEQFNITQGYASWLFGGKSKQSGRRWAAEGAPYHVALLIEIMKRYHITPERIDEIGEPWRRETK